MIHPADSHSLIRVRGARENNLKDISVDLPKRRVTVFTGVSGSGKSSLVFETIAAESQRMINETYSAFLPTLNRPDVDLLDGLTTAIIVDQERLGANSRSTLGTITDVNTQLRILFSRLGRPHIGSAKAFSFNVASVSGAGAITRDRGGGEGQRAPLIRGGGRHVSALRGVGPDLRLQSGGVIRCRQVTAAGSSAGAWLHHGWLVWPHLSEQRVP